LRKTRTACKANSQVNLVLTAGGIHLEVANYFSQTATTTQRRNRSLNRCRNW